MHNLERVLNPHDETPFFVCKLKNADLIHQGNASKLVVGLRKADFVDPSPLDSNNRSLNPWIVSLTARKNEHADFLKDAMVKFVMGEDVPLANPEHPVRWLGSGGMLLIKDLTGTYAVINKREKSLIWQNYFDANGGLSSSILDMLSPTTLAERELKEEIYIAGKDGKRIEPKLNEIPIPTPCKVEINFKGQKFEEDNFILTIDPATGTLDLRKIYVFKCRDIGDLILADGETIVSKEGKHVPIDRPILVFNLNKLLEGINSDSEVLPDFGFQSLSKISESDLANFAVKKNLLTPTLRGILYTLNDINI